MSRHVIFLVHRWLGLIAGLYVLIVSVSGAALVFRIDLQRSTHPHLFTASEGPLAEPVAIMDSVARAYPDHRLSGVDAPTTTRPTYLAYVTAPGTFKTILIDPVTARVLGELPERTAVRSLQDLHYDLLSGRTGRIVNGLGALAIAVLAATGAIEWWRRPRHWRRGRILRELHRLVGVCSLVLVLMWAVTGAYFAFPSAFRAIMGASLSRGQAEILSVSLSRDQGERPAAEIIAAARQHHPNGHVARVVLPSGERGPWLVMFTDRQPTPAYTELTSVYVDQYSGKVIEFTGQAASLGDRITRAMTPLHVGAFGGTPIRMAWFAFGLAPAVLVISGVIVWGRGRWR